MASVEQVAAWPAGEPYVTVSENVLPRRHWQDVIDGYERTLIPPQLVDIDREAVFPARRIPVSRLDLEQHTLPRAAWEALD